MDFIRGPRGFDVSYWQDTCDFGKMRAWGAEFIILRAGHGLAADLRFSAWWPQAKAVGLPRGAYWYYEPQYSPIAQADKAIAMLKNDTPEGRLWLDLEYNPGGAYDSPAHWLAFLRHAESAGLRVGIYTGYAWWIGKAGDKSAFANYPLWLAWYTADPNIVKVPSPWKDCMIWQDGTPAIGRDVGVGSNEIDSDYWNDKYGFTREWGTPPPPSGGNQMKYGTVSSTALNIRAGVGTTYPIIGTLQKGDEVVSDSQAAGWWHIIDAKRNGQDVITNDGRPVRMRIDCWVAAQYVAEHAAPPPPPDPQQQLPEIPVKIVLGDGMQYEQQVIEVVLKPKAR